MNTTATITPQRAERVYDIFRQLNAIPRASHHEEQVADFLCRYAESLGLAYDRDSENCVVIRKSASQGYEDAEPVVLLNHMDMVAVGDGSRPFNPLTDGILAYEDDGWLKARGTSLGADNGIGLSMALAVLADDSLQHPALEVLTTTNEEDGMSGAANLAEDFIKGRRVINLDSEDYDTITVGAAGAYLQMAHIPAGRTASPQGLTFFEVTISGGLGGHSGVDINKCRLNANYEMCRLLFRFRHIPFHHDQREETLHLVSINGGNANASIASACTAVVGVMETDAEEFSQQMEEGFIKIRSRYPAEPNLVLTVRETDPQPEVIADEDIPLLVHGLPCGVIRMRDDIADTVMTSNNIGIISTGEQAVSVSCHTRSFDDAEMVVVATDISHHFEAAGGKVEVIMNTPGWQERQDSDYLRLVSKTFKDVLGFEPRPVAMHFVLEAGYYVQKYPGIEIACIGPRIIEPHSAKERVDISTVNDIYAVLIELLRRCQ